MPAGERRGQATVEYILILAAVVGFTVALVRLLRPVMLGLNRGSAAVVDRYLDKSNLHQLPMQR